jgi:hypothetical protein
MAGGIQHKDAPDGKRHEPKGISTAASGQVYVADGTGSGAWSNPVTAINNRNFVTLNVSIPDLSTAGSYYVTNPILGKIYKAYVTLDNAISVADAVVSFEISGIAVTGGNITATYTGSAAGTTFSSTPSGANTVASGAPIEVITDGGSTTACRASVTILMDVT